MAEVDPPRGVNEQKWEPTWPGKDDFDSEHLNINFQNLRIPLGKDVMSLSDRPGHLRIYGHHSLASTYTQAHIARRWQAFQFDAEAKMDRERYSSLRVLPVTIIRKTGHVYK